MPFVRNSVKRCARTALESRRFAHPRKGHILNRSRRMTRWGTNGSRLAICGALVAIACASSVQTGEPRLHAEAGATGVDADSAAGAGSQASAAGVTESGGNSGSAEGDPVAEAGSEGGALSAPESEAAAKRAPSGKRLCEGDQDCDGLSCTSSAGRQNNACLARCDSDADCKRNERCFGQSSIEKSCFRSCQGSYTECAFQFDCADYYRRNEYLCLPTEWVRNWPAQPSPGS